MCEGARKRHAVPCCGDTEQQHPFHRRSCKGHVDTTEELLIWQFVLGGADTAVYTRHRMVNSVTLFDSTVVPYQKWDDRNASVCLSRSGRVVPLALFSYYIQSYRFTGSSKRASKLHVCVPFAQTATRLATEHKVRLDRQTFKYITSSPGLQVTGPGWQGTADNTVVCGPLPVL